MEAGLMPVLSELVSKGAWGVLESVVPPVTAPAWASFQTGVGPSQHGIYDFQLFDRLTHSIKLVDTRSLNQPTFWEIATHHGKKVITINVPLTYPPKRIPGWVTIGDFLAPRLGPASVHPPELVQELKAWDYQIGLSSLALRHQLSLDDFIDQNIRIERTRFRYAAHLLKEVDWDLCMVHNQSIDGLQHVYYDVLTGLPDTREFQVVSRFYQESDRLLGELLDCVGSDVHVIVLSDHGFKAAENNVNINTWLLQEGFLKINPRRKALRTLSKWVETLDRLNLRNKLVAPWFKTFTGMKVASQSIGYFVDWRRTTAVMVNGNTFGNIFICGPKSGRAKILEDLSARLSELRDPAGRPIVRRLFKTSEAFPGACASSLPDLFFEPHEEFVFTVPILKSDKLVYRPNPVYEQRGCHELDGIYVMNGTTVRSGQQSRYHILDMAPTVLSLLGLPVPRWMDGKAMEGVFQAGLPVSYSDGISRTPADVGYDEDEEELVKKRLRGLGYME
jgi:predicted AlkP superfamily phosphohydrolase/phosphomutase